MRTRRGHSPTHRNDRHDLGGQPDTVLYLPGSLRIVRKGITRNARERTAATLPLTDAQAEVLALLTDAPQRAVRLAEQLDRSAAGVTASLVRAGRPRPRRAPGRAGMATHPTSRERRGDVRKIPTLFKRDPEDMRRVLPEVTPGCEWVLAGEGVPTRKYDGTCVMKVKGIDGREWWARREVKPGKEPPPYFIPVETDETTGKTVGWEPIEQSPFAKFHAEAVAEARWWNLGTYELCGPKINGNPEAFDRHALVPHGIHVFEADPRDFESLRVWLLSHTSEGIVWHHPDGRMAKLKRRDFPRGDTDG